jgi:integrase/recombinase XerD
MDRSSVARVSGPLASWEEAYRLWLAAQGYSPFTVNDLVWQLDGLSRWVERERLVVSELTPERVKQFESARLAAGYSMRWARCTRLPLRFLREIGAVAVAVLAPVVVDGPVEELLGDYRGYLARERGLADSSIENYGRVARLFLSEREGVDGLALERLTAAEVSGFLARECPKRGVAGARDLVNGLRQLLRYLHVAGLISVPLRWAVPAVADLRDRSLPRGLDAATVAKLLAGCDRRRTVGRRDFAILILMVRLGLRAGEVAALSLDDLDWRQGEIVVHGKGSREDRLPLPVDVGQALVSYLRRRPRTESRRVFLRVRAPAGPLPVSGVTHVVSGACVRVGLPPVGAHRLRHTAATGMLRAGASLPEIAQVLRHRQLETTAVYAKVDRKALRPLALPWPGGTR